MSESIHSSSEYGTGSFRGIHDALKLAFYGTDFEDDGDEVALPFSYDQGHDVVRTRIRSKSNFDSERGVRVHVLQVACDLRPSNDREQQNMLFITWEDGYVVLVDLDAEAIGEFVSLGDDEDKPTRDELARIVVGGLSAITTILD